MSIIKTSFLLWFWCTYSKSNITQLDARFIIIKTRVERIDENDEKF